jgi:hypothetical protein
MINFVWSDWVTKGSTDEKIIEEVAKPTEDQVLFHFIYMTSTNM